MGATTPAQIHARLKVFVIAARSLSFTEAGESLCITTAAVSQQIKALEEWLGFKLFQRFSRRLELTEEGERLLATVSPAYANVDLAIHRLRGGPLSGIVRIRSLPSFLGIWLVPRLPLLMQQYPHIELSLEAEDSAHSLREGEFDIAIDLNDGGMPGFQSTVLMQEAIFPVISPKLLAATGRPLASVDDLQHFPVLHDVTAWRGSEPYGEWESYLRAIDAAHVDVRRGYMFNRHQATIDAAKVGMGVAIARQRLTLDELASGLLIEPFGKRVMTGKSYCLVYAAGALDDRRGAAVHNWLVEQSQGEDMARLVQAS
ncbi:LysR family transcriptional regulator [Lampropedia aestuarii]|uniref:LysR family transcriptional regulator n=1 Tax=Lampropedia aestuarii TaxID=2562762 RepID=A0A4S5BPI3_9BURK|nr:LysR substrate-binding domain-containing protein [Lampropedia aestuarii]THJ34614.1 LysR family transcriptional regulator [Lampropedia aestuarii]